LKNGPTTNIACSSTVFVYLLYLFVPTEESSAIIEGVSNVVQNIRAVQKHKNKRRHVYLLNVCKIFIHTTETVRLNVCGDGMLQ
jgi:hypothetical protein